MGEAEMLQIAGYIARVLENPRDERTLAGVRREVEALCGDFPLYAGRSSGPG
jgi:glycine/serine hydroxymethyltransferase